MRRKAGSSRFVAICFAQGVPQKWRQLYRKLVERTSASNAPCVENWYLGPTSSPKKTHTHPLRVIVNTFRRGKTLRKTAFLRRCLRSWLIFSRARQKERGKSSIRLKGYTLGIRVYITLTFDLQSIVFSCWTRSLDLVGLLLKQRNIPFVRIDGSNSLNQQNFTLNHYHNDPTTKILLMTTGTGAVGSVSSPVFESKTQH
jgi:SNF2 family DNA or RNA helicase